MTFSWHKLYPCHCACAPQTHHIRPGNNRPDAASNALDYRHPTPVDAQTIIHDLFHPKLHIRQHLVVQLAKRLLWSGFRETLCLQVLHSSAQQHLILFTAWGKPGPTPDGSLISTSMHTSYTHKFSKRAHHLTGMHTDPVPPPDQALEPDADPPSSVTAALR